MAVTERRATTSRHRVAPHANRGKSWVLAMLAPKRGLRVAPVPPKAADLTRPARGRRDNGRSGRRNRRFDRTKEQPRARRGLAVTIIRRLQSITQWWATLHKRRTSWPCRHDHPSLTVDHPMVGETAQASHTEIRTLPKRTETENSTRSCPCAVACSDSNGIATPSTVATTHSCTGSHPDPDIFASTDTRPYTGTQFDINSLPKIPEPLSVRIGCFNEGQHSSAARSASFRA